MRFNPLAQNRGGTLSVSLLLRYRSKGLSITRIEQVGFLMSRAKVNGYPDSPTEVGISVKEWYCNQKGEAELRSFKVKLYGRETLHPRTE